ncbi:MAG: TraB/GumN family protein [Rubellimicrobium sp.]|nr:TraB/GumN family protein [Rubellimicrobium sp.]
MVLLRLAVLCAALVTGLFTASAASALCSGPSLIDRLTPAELKALDARTAEIPFSDGLLWTAERDGKTVTLIGTMHIFDPRLAPIRDRVGPMIAAADLLLLEMTPAEEREMQAAMANDPSLMFLTDGPTLPELLDDETWAAVADAARARNIPPFMAAKFQPWFLMLTLSMPACAMDHMMMGEQGLDHMLMTDAAAAGVAMQALEDWDTLFRIFDEGTIEEQLDYLALSLMSPELSEEMFVAMLDGYFAGEVARIWELSRFAMRFMPGLDPDEADALFDMTDEALLARRNHAWIPVIEAAAARHDDIVVAAGAAHLPGEDGVLYLLAEQGWTIRPMP